MGETWYRVIDWRDEITTVVAESSTAQTLMVRSKPFGGTLQRTAKQSSHSMHFATWQEAQQYLVKRNRTRVEGAKLALQKARTALGMAESLTPPDATGAGA